MLLHSDHSIEGTKETTSSYDFADYTSPSRIRPSQPGGGGTGSYADGSSDASVLCTVA